MRVPASLPVVGNARWAAGLACCMGMSCLLSQSATLGSFKRSSTQSSPPTRPAKVVWTRLTYIHGFLLGLVYHRYLAVKVARGVLLLVLHTAPLPCS